jgi:hypothetical protein
MNEYGVIHEIGDYSSLRNTKDSQAIEEQVKKSKEDDKSSNDDESR